MNACPELVRILKYLPEKVSSAVGRFAETLRGNERMISEIRLRAGAPMSVTYLDRNIFHFAGEAVVCSEIEVAQTLQRLCEDSVHTYSETLREGYVALENGYRIGVCGHAGINGESVRSVYGISSLSIRIPHPIYGVSADVLRYIRSGERIHSALIYSPPNVGKTTLIRDIASSLSRGENSYRVAVIDTRGEIYMRAMFSDSIADVLAGYPRAKAIEIATRTLSPEVIICDEIGGPDEAKAILSAQNSGVPMIATAHADSANTLLRRPNIKTLYDNRIFRYLIGLRRAPGMCRFEFDIRDIEQEAALFCET